MPVKAAGEKGRSKRGVPFSQAWLYEFYYHFEDRLLPNQKSIINAVLEGLSGEDAQLEESTATKRQKSAAVKIIQSVLVREGGKVAGDTAETESGA